jgi:predicted nucleic acid-binding protein
MIVVADTSPINYLIQIGCVNLLYRLYSEIIVPASVLEELQHSGAPDAVRGWAAGLPGWVRVVSPSVPADSTLEALGPGEREAIQICAELDANLLLIDDRRGRTEAIRRGLSTTGTLGVLLSAAELGWLDPHPAYRELIDRTSFRVSAEMEAQFFEHLRRIS